MRTELDIIAEKEYIRKEALKEKAEAIARNMLADHVAVATIARYTGLSEETVLGLMGTV